MATTAEDTVNLTREIDRWLLGVGINEEGARADLAVDLADILAAAQRVESDLRSLLSLVAPSGKEADEALALAADIEVQLFTEAQSHMKTLQKAWPYLLQRLEQRASASKNA
jgi:hypothetical protein